MIPIICAIFPIIMFSIALVDLIHNKLIFYDDRLLVTGQKLNRGIQYKEIIYYSSIKDIRIICAHIDSRGKAIKNDGIISMRPHIYFEFILHDGTSKLVHIEIYSINQRKKILDIINRMAKLNFSYDHLKKIDLSMFKKKKP